MDDIKKEVAEGFEKKSCILGVDESAHMEATTEAFAAYAAKYIANRFPEGLPEKLYAIMAEIVVENFCNGAEWADREAMRQDVMVAPRQVIL